MRRGDNGGLTFHAGSRVAHLAGTVVVDGRAKNVGANGVAARQSLRKTLQNDDAGPVSRICSLCAGIECPAVAVRRKDAVLLVEVARLFGTDAHSTCQCYVAVTSQQALTGKMHGDERGRTSRLDVDAGTPQVQLI